MSLEIMKGIQQAEAQADEIRQTAQREARDVVKAVEAAIAQQERTAAIENRAQYAQEDKKQEVEHQLNAQRAKAGKQREALCQQARKHLPEAVSAIYERVLQHGDR